MTPLAFDLCCGSGGWASGLMQSGWKVVGFDIDPQPLYPGEFNQRDVKTIQPEELDGVKLIVASPPCEQFSRHGMPWTRKRNPPPPDTSIVEHVRWLAKETGIPLVMENVKFAQAFIGPAKHTSVLTICGETYLPIRHRSESSKRKKATAVKTDLTAPEYRTWLASGLERHLCQ